MRALLMLIGVTLTVAGAGCGEGCDPASTADAGSAPFCADQDSDTICDADEGSGDLDGDGLPNLRDPDSDGDGVSDQVEAGDSDPATPPRDQNSDGVPDYLDDDVTSAPDAGSGDAAIDPALCPPQNQVAAGCSAETNEGLNGLCDGLDNDCDGHVDENCGCNAGDVQACFGGPPGRRGVGACTDGNQRCIMSGEAGAFWGECEGHLVPSAERCDALDNDCNGCVDEIAGCTPAGACPGPGDPRVPSGLPLTDYPLRGGDFYSGPAQAWHWQVEGGPCDSFPLAVTSFDLVGADQQNAVLKPRLSGDYTVHLTVTTPDGTFSCVWVVHIFGPGLRIELCYPEANDRDLDLVVKQPGMTGPWYDNGATAMEINYDSCSWANCEATLRGDGASRADWGYADSDLALCSGGPQGDQWTDLGYCANPRLDIDNNLVEGSGLPENINIDAPRDSELFRIMVQNFTGTLAHPVVNVYCDGHRSATYGMAPDALIGYQGVSGHTGVGAMWRVADVTTHVDSQGHISCDVDLVQSPANPLPNGQPYDVTYDDPRY